MQIGSSERWHSFDCITLKLGNNFSRIFFSLRLSLLNYYFQLAVRRRQKGVFLYSSLAVAASLQCVLWVLTQSPLVALHKTNEISLILLSSVWRHPFHKSFRDKKKVQKGKNILKWRHKESVAWKSQNLSREIFSARGYLNSSRVLTPLTCFQPL